MENASSKIYSVETNNSDRQPNETFVLRNPRAVNLDLREFVGHVTVQDYYRSLREERGGREFIGLRPRLGPNAFDPAFKWVTGGEFIATAEKFGSSLLDKKLFTEGVEYKGRKMNFFGVYSKNTYEVFLADAAAVFYGLTIVPISDTAGMPNVVRMFNLTELSACLFQESSLAKVLGSDPAEFRKQFPRLRHAVLSADEVSLELRQKEAKFDVKIFTVKELVASSASLLPWVAITPSDIYALSFTSGTNGEPRAAMISHSNITSIQAQVNEIFMNHPSPDEDCILSYLPMSHILERSVFIMAVALKIRYGIYSGNLNLLREDILSLRPTLFFSVPRLYSRLYARISAELRQKPKIYRNLAEQLIRKKIDVIGSNSYTHWLYDRLLKNFRASLGGRVRLLFTGSAPLAPNIKQFLKAVFACPFLEIYGQTEGTGLEVISGFAEPSATHVGGPCLHNEIKIVDVPELGYMTSDRDATGLITPRGELWVRGPNVTSGYFRDDEAFGENFTADGWLKSGDIVKLTPPQNYIEIIDLKKSIFKLSQGEYIAPLKLESIYAAVHPLINDVYIHGCPLDNFIVAIINIEKSNVKSIAADFGLDPAAEEQLLLSKLQDELFKRFETAARANNLNSLEIVREVFIDISPFRENELLTPTLKKKRPAFAAYYKHVIQEMHKRVPIEQKFNL